MSNVNTGQRYERNTIHYLYLDVDLTDIPLASQNVLPVGILPGGAVIHRAYTVTRGQPPAPGGAQIQIGFRNREGVTDDPDGIKAGFAPGTGVSADTVVSSATALFFDEPGEVTVARGATAFTAGRVRIVVEYTVPNNEE